jgi:hypothetical protein
MAGYATATEQVARILGRLGRLIDAEEAELRGRADPAENDVPAAVSLPDAPEREALREAIRDRSEEIEHETAQFDRAPSSAPLSAQIQRRQRATRTGWLGVAGAWLATLVILYLLLAFPVSRQALPINVAGTGFASAVLDLRAYLARVSGTLPLLCFSETPPDQEDWRKGGTPLLVQATMGVPSEESLPNCAWWPHERNPQIQIPELVLTHLFAALSLEVGVFQKLSLLLFIIGLRASRTVRADIVLTRALMADVSGASPLDDTAARPLFPGRRLAVNAGRPAEILAAVGDGAPQRLRDPYVVYAEGLSALAETVEQGPMAGTLCARVVRYLETLAHEGLDFGTRPHLIETARKAEQTMRELGPAQPWYQQYLLWALPTIGFLGTIFGISMALIQAAPILGGAGGKFDPVVEALGVAFDTTAFALVLLAFLTLRDSRDTALSEAALDHAMVQARDRLLDRLRPAQALSDTALVERAATLAALMQKRRLERRPPQEEMHEAAGPDEAADLP